MGFRCGMLQRWSILNPAPWPFTSRGTCPVPLLTDRRVASVKNAKATKKCNIPTLKGLSSRKKKLLLFYESLVYKDSCTIKDYILSNYRSRVIVQTFTNQ